MAYPLKWLHNAENFPTDGMAAGSAGARFGIDLRSGALSPDGSGGFIPDAAALTTLQNRWKAYIPSALGGTNPNIPVCYGTLPYFRWPRIPGAKEDSAPGTTDGVGGLVTLPGSGRIVKSSSEYYASILLLRQALALPEVGILVANGAFEQGTYNEITDGPGKWTDATGAGLPDTAVLMDWGYDIAYETAAVFPGIPIAGPSFNTLEATTRDPLSLSLTNRGRLSLINLALSLTAKIATLNCFCMADLHLHLSALNGDPNTTLDWIRDRITKFLTYARTRYPSTQWGVPASSNALGMVHLLSGEHGIGTVPDSWPSNPTKPLSQTYYGNYKVLRPGTPTVYDTEKYRTYLVRSWNEVFLPFKFTQVNFAPAINRPDPPYDWSGVFVYYGGAGGPQTNQVLTVNDLIYDTYKSLRA